MNSTKKIKVLVVLSNLRVSNGVASYIMNYFRKLDHDVIQMDFALYQDIKTPYYAEIKKYGDRIYILPSVKSLWKHIAYCDRILKDNNYDIVHDNTLLLSYFMMRCAKRRSVPVRILHSHNSCLGETKYKELRNKAFLPFLLETANLYFSCSDLAAQTLFGKRPYIFVPNVIPRKKFYFKEIIRRKIRDELQCHNKFVIGTVGRLAAQKNPFRAIDIIIEVHKHYPDIQYWWIGSGPLMQEVKFYIEKKQATSYIQLFGSRNDVVDLYQAMDLFFLPSLFEGLPVTGIEAQAMGLPCLVSDTITKEFVYTDLVSFFSIKQPLARTASIILSYLKKECNRKAYSYMLDQSRFSDKNAGEFLSETYRQIYQKYIGESDG